MADHLVAEEILDRRWGEPFLTGAVFSDIHRLLLIDPGQSEVQGQQAIWRARLIMASSTLYAG